MTNIIEITDDSNIIEITDNSKLIELLATGTIYVNGGGGGGGANLAYTASPTQGIVTSDSGTDATIPAGSATNASLMLPDDKTKLDGVASGATANATDAQLRDRTTHTGTQAISTVSGLQTALDGKQATGDYATNTTLTNGLATKANVSHTHVIADVTGLQTALDGKQTTGDYATNTALTNGLAGKENTITAGTTAQYFRGDKTFQTLDKSAVGLSNVDNTSDLNKPISSATQTALNAKQNTITTGTISQYFRGDLSLATLDKTAVGLNNVANVDTTTTANITDSSNKRFITDAQQTVVSNTSGTNTGDNAVNTTANTYADGKVADSIADGVTTIAPSQNAVFDALASKQATLVSGTNIKTINGDSILGSGNLVVSGGGGGGITNAQSIVNALIFG